MENVKRFLKYVWSFFSIKWKPNQMCYNYGERDDQYCKDPMICELSNDFRIIPEYVTIRHFLTSISFL